MNRDHFIKTEPWKIPKDKSRGYWFITEITRQDGEETDKQLFIKLPCLHAPFVTLILHSVNDKGEVNNSVLFDHVDNKGNPYLYHKWIILDGWDPKCYKVANEKFVREII